MQTLPVPTKNVKAFYAFLDDTHGVLTKVHGTMYFMATETGDITEIEPEHCPFLMPLGECGVANAQRPDGPDARRRGLYRHAPADGGVT